MLLIGLFIALVFFFYIQKKNSDRNMKRFQRSREKFEQLLEQVRENKEEASKETNDDK